jgi:hypothetical protein
VDWGSFFSGVGVTVVGGLILAVVIGSARWYIGRPERKAKEAEAEAKEAEAETIRRTPIRVGGHIVADELRWNADVAKRCEGGSHVPTEGSTMRLEAWRDRQGEMAGLRDEAPGLWQELIDTYTALELTRVRGAYPPRSDDLLVLAERLDDAAESK